MRDFKGAFRRGSRHLDATYAERLRIIPWLAGDMLAGGPDPARPAFVAMGVLDFETKIQRVEGQAGVTGARSDLVTPTPHADFDMRAFDNGPQPEAGWRIEAIDRAAAPVFKIIAVQLDGVARITCPLLRV